MVNLSKKPVFIAIDVGATSLKIVPSLIEDDLIKPLPYSSIKNYPLVCKDIEYVDINLIISSVVMEIQKLSNSFQIISIGIDTYGNGYGFISSEGVVIQDPYYYRDRRVDNIWTNINRIYTKRELYDLFGNFPIKTRGLFHLYQDRLDNDKALMPGNVILPLPNLLEYILTSKIGAEKTIASVLYFLNLEGNNWNYPVFKKMSIPIEILPSLHDGGEVLGYVKRALIPDIKGEMPLVVRVIGHDTESALASVSCLNEKSLFLSLGTSFILGTRIHTPIVNDVSYQYRFKNMKGEKGWYSLCKDFPGFWIFERCIELWNEDKNHLSYEYLCEQAKNVTENDTYLDISDDIFRISEINILSVIHKYCIDTHQKFPKEIGSMTQCLFESYCLYIRWNIEKLKKITKSNYTVLYALNGGVKNSYLMQMLADCIQIEVHAESSIASAIGNLSVQYQTIFGKDGVFESFETIYYPKEERRWNEKYYSFINRGILEEEKDG